MTQQIEPSHDNIFVVDRQPDAIIDGIFLPANRKEQEMAFGIVVFVGPEVSERTKPGQVVVYGPYAGHSVVVGDIEYRTLPESKIEGYLRQK